MKRLFVFDMDGTLLPGTTAMIQIAKIMGHTEELERLEKQLHDREIENAQFAKAIHSLWSALTPDIVQKAFAETPKLQNIRPTLEKISAFGGIPCLITSAPDFFADHFHDYGFEHIFASKPFNLQERVFTPELILHGKDKPIFAEKLCQKLNLNFTETVAFGDSLSDIPLFQTLTHTVSVNGDDHIRSFAKYHYTGPDLMGAFSLIVQ